MLFLAGLIVLCVVLWYLISFLLSLMSVSVFLGILAILLVLGRLTLPVLFDVLGPDRKWEREKGKRLMRPKQQRCIIVRDAGSVAFLAHLPRGDQRTETGLQCITFPSARELTRCLKGRSRSPF